MPNSTNLFRLRMRTLVFSTPLAFPVAMLISPVINMLVGAPLTNQSNANEAKSSNSRDGMDFTTKLTFLTAHLIVMTAHTLIFNYLERRNPPSRDNLVESPADGNPFPFYGAYVQDGSSTSTPGHNNGSA